MRAPEGDPGALRTVLALALDRPTVRACLGEPAAAPPASVYTWAATTAVCSTAVWARLAHALDRRLAGCLPAFVDAPPSELATVLAAPECLDDVERAAALWALLRRRDPGFRRFSARLARCA